MRIIIQRVKSASVTIGSEYYSSIKQGMLILLGIEDADTFEDVEWLSGKISCLRIFNDDVGVMNKSVSDIRGEILVVSQFTLHAAIKKGNRPSYIRAAKPEFAISMYENFVDKLGQVSECEIKTGKFAAMMDVELVNDGPVTIIIDSKQRDF